MPINKSLLKMTPAELTAFVALRRSLRVNLAKTSKTKQPRAKGTTVAKLAKELGVDASRVISVLEDEINAKS